jgi:hypothetical protein
LRLAAGHAQHIELADEIAEYDCAVAGHGHNHRTANAIINAASGNGGGFFFFRSSWAKSEKNNRICPIDSPASSGFV